MSTMRRTYRILGYFLKNNKWTPKPTKKIGEMSASKEKTPFGSNSKQRSVKKSLTHEFEGSEMEMGGFMIQVMQILLKLNEKVDNVIPRTHKFIVIM